jgi:CheY-like chemotaxis protein
VVDADARGAVAQVASADRVAQTLFIGSHAPAAALARLPRPIDALHVLRELDCALLMNLPAVAPATRHTDSHGDRELPGTAVGGPRTEPASLHAPSQLSELANLFPDRLEAAHDTRNDPGSGFDALIVDDSEIALRFLEQRLAALGVRARGVGDSDAALEQLARHAYPLVFLDVELGEGSKLDGLALCQYIKRRDGVAPIVAMVSAHTSATDRVRGHLAGCDAYLGKPLVADELAGVVARLRSGAARTRRHAR